MRNNTNNALVTYFSSVLSWKWKIKPFYSGLLKGPGLLATGHYLSPGGGSGAEDFAGGITRFLEEQKGDQ